MPFGSEADGQAQDQVVNQSENSTGSESSASTAAAEQDAGSAESSTANGEDAKKPGTLLDAVRDALKPQKGEQSSGSEGQAKEGAESAAAAEAEGEDEDPGEITDDELNRLHSKTRKRMKFLLKQKGELEGKVGELEPRAQQFDRLHGYMTNAGLSVEEVNAGFEIMRLMKQSPEQALASLMPYVNALQSAVGEILPSDLQEQVRQGFVTEAHAKELARLRSSEARRAEASRAATEAAERRQVADRQQLAHDASSAVSEWEKKWSASDPDYAKKSGRVLEKIENRLLKGPLPKSKQEALALAEQCKAEVEKEMRALLPRRPEVRHPTGQASQPSSRQPQSTLDVVKMAIGAA